MSHGLDTINLHLLARTSAADFAQLCGVTLKCYLRWCKAKSFPVYAQNLARLASGQMINPAWDNWQICPADNKLYSPHLKDGFTPRQIESLHYLQQRCEQLERLNAAPAQYLLEY